MVLNSFYIKNSFRENEFKDILIIFCIISFLFLWDIKVSVHENFTLSFREFFYLLLFYLIYDYKKLLNKTYLRILIFFTIFLLYNIYTFDIKFENLDLKYNLLPIVLLFFIYCTCSLYKEKILNNLNLSFLIFIYIFIFSFLFSKLVVLHPNEAMRICGLVNFKFINQIIFLEPSHLGMILVPFYYFVFKTNNIGSLNKYLLLFFLIFLFIFFYSVTLLFSVIVCFALMLLIDYRFFLRNKLFLLAQVSILISPIFLNSCVFKVSHALDNFSYKVDIENYNTKKIQVIAEKKYAKIISDLDKNKMNEIDLYIKDDFTISKLTEVQILKILPKLNKTILEIDNRINYLIDQSLIGSEPELSKENFEILKINRRNLDNLRKIINKKNIELKLNNFSAAEMNYLIRKHVDWFPLNNDKKINDHSSAVLLNAIYVTYFSLKEKPFGWGFNNYQTAFNKYMLEKITPPFPEIYYLNYNDASNNFLKLIVEFGIFSFLIFLNLLYFLLNKNVSISQRILFGGIIITQMARAAGYYNGGFILCLVLTFILNYQNYNINKNEKKKT